MKKRLGLGFVILVLFVLSSSVLTPDDREIFSASVPPYVFFILDNSGSMGDQDFYICNADTDPDKLADFQSYTTSTGRTYTYDTEEELGPDICGWVWNARRRRWEWRCVPGEPTGEHYATRIEALKRAATEVLDQTRDSIKMGVSHFFYSGTDSSQAHGARVFAPVQDYSSGDATRDTAFNALTDYINNNLSDDHYTPLSESMDTVYGYFSGLISSTDGNRWTDMYGNTRIPAGSTPPPQYTCQRTFFVLITDGFPTADDTNWGYPEPYTGIYPMSNNSTCLPNVAKYLYEHPVSPATDGIVTYTVGMKMDSAGQTLLQTTSDNAHGHGDHFPGDNFEQLITNLQTVLSDIDQRNYAFTQYTSPKKIATAEDEFNVSYSGYFFSNADTVPIWAGHLKCNDIIPYGSTYIFHECWDAAAVMNTQGEANRTISALKTAANSHTFTNVDFINSSKATLLNALSADNETEAGNIIDYIRGTSRPDVAAEDMFLLADIFHSTVTYMGQPLLWKSFYNPPECNPASSSTDNDCYQKFYLDNQDRQRVVFAGTNDGVIHTINADRDEPDGGTEISGFIPDEILPSLKRIAVNRYFTYTADGLMTVNDIYTGTTDHWRSILAFGLREGGKAYYCRDVSNPSSQSHRWKFPAYVASGTVTAINTNDYTYSNASGTFGIDQYVVNEKRTAKGRISALPDTNKIRLADTTGTFSIGDKLLALPSYSKYIGYTWGKPIITRIKFKKGTNGTIQDKWVAILTGGFGEGTNLEGKAIFIVDAWTGSLIWQLGYASSDSIDDNQYLKNDSNLNYAIPQSLTAIDKDNNTYIDALYFGNLGGNLFKLDISDPLTSTWIPKILFRENDIDQPIYMSPSVSYDQCYQLWVHFGTGNRNHPQDGPSGRFIGLRDDSTIPTNGCVRSTNLQQLSWTLNTMGDTTITGANGWYFNFPDSNEILFDPDPIVIPNNTMPYLYFNTYQPQSVVVGGDPCGSGGNMTFYKINLHSCGDIVSGNRESARISGGGLITGSKYLMYVGTGETGSLEIKRFESYDIPYPGGIIYWKETKR